MTEKAYMDETAGMIGTLRVEKRGTFRKLFLKSALGGYWLQNVLLYGSLLAFKGFFKGSLACLQLWNQKGWLYTWL